MKDEFTLRDGEGKPCVTWTEADDEWLDQHSRTLEGRGAALHVAFAALKIEMVRGVCLSLEAFRCGWRRRREK